MQQLLVKRQLELPLTENKWVQLIFDAPLLLHAPTPPNSGYVLRGNRNSTFESLSNDSMAAFMLRPESQPPSSETTGRESAWKTSILGTYRQRGHHHQRFSGHRFKKVNADVDQINLTSIPGNNSMLVLHFAIPERPFARLFLQEWGTHSAN